MACLFFQKGLWSDCSAPDVDLGTDRREAGEKKKNQRTNIIDRLERGHCGRDKVEMVRRQNP